MPPALEGSLLSRFSVVTIKVWQGNPLGASVNIQPANSAASCSEAFAVTQIVYVTVYSSLPW